MQDTTQPDEYIPRPVYNKKENKLISMTYEKKAFKYGLLRTLSNNS